MTHLETGKEVGLPTWLSVNESPMQEMQETRVGSLDWKDSLEKGMAIHSSILAWEIPWPEEPGGLQSVGLQRVRHDLVLPPELYLTPFPHPPATASASPT